MRKSISLSLLLALILAAPIGAETVRIGAFCDYFAPQGALIKEIYGESGDVLYGARLQVMVFKGLQASVSYGQYKKFSVTTELNDITRLTLNPLTLGLRYSAPLGRLNPFVEAAYVILSHKEESDIGNNSGKDNGWMFLGGIEFLLSNRFGLSLEFKTQNIEGATGSDGYPVSFKGYSGGISFFVRI